MAYREPPGNLRQLRDDELYARRAKSTRNSWEFLHTETELLRRQNRRSGRLAWIAIWISVLALATSLAELLHDITNPVQTDARGTQAEPG